MPVTSCCIADLLVGLLVELLDDEHPHFGHNLLPDDALESSLKLASDLGPDVSLRKVEVNEGRVYV